MPELDIDDSEPTDNETIIDRLAAEAETILKESDCLYWIDEDIYADGAIEYAFTLEWQAEQIEQHVTFADPTVVADRVITRMTLAQDNHLVKDHIAPNRCTNCGLGIAGAAVRTPDVPGGQRADVSDKLVCSRCDERILPYR